MGYKYNPFIGNLDRVGSGSGADAVETLTGNSGGAVSPDGSFNINILGSGNYTVTGSPGTNTLTLSDNGTLADTYIGDTGSASPSSGTINLLGDSNQGSITSASGDTITFTNSDASTSQKGVSELATDAESIAGSDNSRTIVPSSLAAKLGSQTSNALAYGNTSTGALQWTSALTNGQVVIGSTSGSPQGANITGGTGINITNGSNSILLNTHGSVPDSFVTDSGTATPSSHSLNVVGGGNVSTSGSGSTITITGSGGILVQQVRATTSTTGSTATAIPFDNSIPQNTEGAQVLTTSITPTNASNILKIEFDGWGHQSAASEYTVAIFQDSGADAIYATNGGNAASSGNTHVSGCFYMVAGTASSTTFNLRVGAAAGTTYWLRSPGTDNIYGGVSSFNLIISEIEV